MDLLTKLAQVYETDKWGIHAYTPYYYELFAAKRDQIHNVLEIGVFNGVSLRMWQAFFPKASIRGIDVNPNHVCNEGRIKTFLADQRNEEALRVIGDVCGPFDIIVEDASHEPEDQAFTANVLIPYVKTGGYYIIEDVRLGNKERVQEAIKFPTKVVEFNIATQTDDRLIICER